MEKEKKGERRGRGEGEDMRTWRIEGCQDEGKMAGGRGEGKGREEEEGGSEGRMGRKERVRRGREGGEGSVEGRGKRGEGEG